MTMNTYEAKQAARKANYEIRAAQAQRQADTTHAQAQTMAQAIPFGQPILVGHHSERSDRRYRERVSRSYEKSYELQKKAEHYADKAASVGIGWAYRAFGWAPVSGDACLRNCRNCSAAGESV
jgi:hypothetical protein